MLFKVRNAALVALAVCISTFTTTAQELAPNTSANININVGETREFSFKGKKGDFWQLKESREWSVYPDVALIGPDGTDVLSGYEGYLRALVLPATGEYKLRFTLTRTDDGQDAKPGPHDLTVGYTDIFSMARGSVRVAKRMVGGYTAEIWQSKDEYVTTLKIMREGGLEAVLIGESNMPFQFADTAADGKTAAERRAAQLWRTADKTGDGVPDLAIEYYSGGAHCCYDMLFYELGKEVVMRRTLSTADSGVIPMRRNPKGGLRLRTADMSFAYWNISFAGSPAPVVILDFQNGEWRPNFSAMKRPAPSDAVLKKKAEAAKKLLSAAPYTNEDDYFEEAFWGEMLDLIYSGNESAAWKYFDMVWREDKPGKEKFKSDFNEQLKRSQFWQMIIADTPRKEDGL